MLVKLSISNMFIEDELKFRELEDSQWSLELHIETAQPLNWRTTFSTELNAWAVFIRAVRIDGMKSAECH